MEAIILLGGPGAGKGTLAEELRKETGFLHVSTGDMLRAAVKAETIVGAEAKPFMESGNLVPDSVILRIIKERIEQEGSDAKFMFDGFPRTLEQAKGLDLIFKETGGKVIDVINLMVDPPALIARLCGRRTCKKCGAIYHLVNMPPKQEGICDVDGGELYQRTDDNEETVRNRLEVYKKQTAPLIEYYWAKNLLRDVDAGGSIANTVSSALAALNGHA